MEIYCPDLRIDHGFQVLGECALNQRVTMVYVVKGFGPPAPVRL